MLILYYSSVLNHHFHIANSELTYTAHLHCTHLAEPPPPPTAPSLFFFAKPPPCAFLFVSRLRTYFVITVSTYAYVLTYLGNCRFSAHER